MRLTGSFMAFDVNGGRKISFTYNEIDDDSGNLISDNNKKNFYAIDKELLSHVNAIFDYIKKIGVFQIELTKYKKRSTQSLSMLK